MSASYPDTIRQIVEVFPDLTPELQKAARFFLENPEDIGLNSMRSVARAAGVRPATVSRLSKALGFENYKALREPFRQRLRTSDPKFASGVADLQTRGKRGSEELYAELRRQELTNIERSLSGANYPAIIDAVATMDESRRVYVLGLRGAYAAAFLFHYTYQLFQENSYLVDAHAGIFADQMRGIGEPDCLLAISFPPYTQLTIDATHYAAEAGAHIIAVTDTIVSPVASAAGQTIIASNRSASFYHSFTGALAVIEALITLLVARKGGDAVAIAKEAERQLSRVSAFW